MSLEAFSPFIPLNAEDSALPATVMRFTVKNAGRRPRSRPNWPAGWRTPSACTRGRAKRLAAQPRRRARPQLTFLECQRRSRRQPQGARPRPDIVFDDFEKETYDGWTATGTAFGTGPIDEGQDARLPGRRGRAGQAARQLARRAPGEDVGGGDAHAAR